MLTLVNRCHHPVSMSERGGAVVVEEVELKRLLLSTEHLLTAQPSDDRLSRILPHVRLSPPILSLASLFLTSNDSCHIPSSRFNHSLSPSLLYSFFLFHLSLICVSLVHPHNGAAPEVSGEVVCVRHGCVAVSEPSRGAEDACSGAHAAVCGARLGALRRSDLALPWRR